MSHFEQASDIAMAIAGANYAQNPGNNTLRAEIYAGAGTIDIDGVTLTAVMFPWFPDLRQVNDLLPATEPS